MVGLGLHILMEFHECEPQRLDDLTLLKTTMSEAAIASGATIIKSVFHQFSPQGVTGVVVVAESHLAIHTWPEKNYAAVDYFTCNENMDYKKAFNIIAEVIGSKTNNYKCIERGVLEKEKVVV
ncbi:MAG: adenosylmethionine decarboxylase [Flavobacteriales bacterium]|jgi:S-adenosylmethionine decarboxylase proenzyme|tara:strand:+ start:1827 stop:2195 length:369 start_codon:yes stop_codon:yes gene_type:complete